MPPVCHVRGNEQSSVLQYTWSQRHSTYATQIISAPTLGVREILLCGSARTAQLVLRVSFVRITLVLPEAFHDHDGLLVYENQDHWILRLSYGGVGI
jgi:hypothetical protein